MSRCLAVLACGFLATLAADVRADLVATYQIWHGGGRQGIIESITHRTYLSEEFAADDGLGTLFEDIVLFDGDTRVDIANETVEPDFVEFAELITDGLDWWLYKKMDFAFGSLSGFNLESIVLEFVDPDHQGVDLNGYAVESVTRTITVELDSPGRDPGGDGNWTDFLVTGVYEIYGSPIPEPASLVLLALGGAYVLRPASYPHPNSDFLMAAVRAGLHVDHISEHAVDEPLAARSPRAAKYLGWPMLLMMRFQRGKKGSG